MRIISPSWNILDTLDRQSLPVRIEYCGRICYKSEHRITADSAIPFVQKIAANRHFSVLEMGVTTLRVTCPNEEPIRALLARHPKYLLIDQLDGPVLSITGSVRAFLELDQAHPGDAICRAMAAHIRGRHPYFFTDTPENAKNAALPETTATALSAISVEPVSLAEVERMPPELLARHRHLAVKFIVNRAVTHELVRHRPCAFLQESQRYCRYSADTFGNEVTFIKPVFFDEESPEFAVWLQAMETAEAHYFRLLHTSTPQAARTVLPNSCKTEIILYTNLLEWRHIFSLRTSGAADPSMREVMIPLHQEMQRRFPGIF
ncbi:MAG: FAD-dependent thymidylate synthase [Desulfobulbus sp.]|jgi:thymidylate synthase (FAD)